MAGVRKVCASTPAALLVGATKPSKTVKDAKARYPHFFMVVRKGLECLLGQKSTPQQRAEVLASVTMHADFTAALLLLLALPPVL